MTVAGDCFAALATTARVKTELIILTRPLAARKSPPPPDSRSRRRGVSMTGGEAIRERRKSRPDGFIIKPDNHMPGPNSQVPPIPPAAATGRESGRERLGSDREK